MSTRTTDQYMQGMAGSGGTGSFVRTDYALTLLRVWLGVMLMTHGLPKIFGGIGPLTESVAGMGFPVPALFAWSAALSEALGGLLLIVGLAVRPAAMFASVTMVVVVFIRHAADPFAKKELPLTYLIILVFLTMVGSGAIGVDAFIRSKRR